VRAQFDRDPEFVPLAGTAVKYAINSSSTVLSVGRNYYLWRDGKWFRSSSPTGAYSPIDTPPDELTSTE
jgi:hypothetical protein